MGYTADILGTKGVKILDSDGNAIKTIQQKRILVDNPSLPYIIIDKLLMEKRKDHPINFRIISYDDLRRMGIVVVSVKMHWYAGQSNAYRFARIGRIPVGAKVVKQIPAGHVIKYDNANKILSIEGRNANPNNVYMVHL